MRLLRVGILVVGTAALDVAAGSASPERLLALGALLAGLIGLRLVDE